MKLANNAASYSCPPGYTCLVILARDLGKWVQQGVKEGLRLEHVLLTCSFLRADASYALGLCLGQTWHPVLPHSRGLQHACFPALRPAHISVGSACF